MVVAIWYNTGVPISKVTGITYDVSLLSEGVSQMPVVKIFRVYIGVIWTVVPKTWLIFIPVGAFWLAVAGFLGLVAGTFLLSWINEWLEKR